MSLQDARLVSSHPEIFNGDDIPCHLSYSMDATY